MKRATGLWVLSVVMSLAMAGVSHAQYRAGFPLYRQTYVPRPMFSPYLNLFRNDVPLFLNYYGLVEPQFPAQAAIGQLQQGVSNLQDASMAGKEIAMPATGIRSGYMTQSRYFMTLGGSSGGRTMSRGGQTGSGQQGGISSGGSFGGGIGGVGGVGSSRSVGSGVGAVTGARRR
ncbi:MAG: hypothetical protein FJ271_14200 [Planctomycetes bacterium]|nr:hypothetical protein [Planctomycetota bacterium]